MAAAAVLLLSGLPAWAATQPENGKNTDPGYTLRFEGNEHIGKKMLKQAADSELDDFREDGYEQADIDDAAFQMRLYYRNEGYAFAEVNYRYQAGPGKVDVLFEISEGPRILVDHIAFSGAEAFDRETLLAFFDLNGKGVLAAGKPVFVETEIEKAIAEIRAYYQENGYQDIKIEEPKFIFSHNRQQVVIRINIEEGPHYFIKKIVFKGDLYPEIEKLLNQIDEDLSGQIYYRRRDLEVRSRILDIYGNNGYPNTEIELTATEEKPGDVVLEAKIESGPEVWIEEVIVTGNEQTRDSFIRSRLTLQAGDLYSSRERRRSFTELYRTGLFHRVNMTLEEGSDKNHRILQVAVEESPSREVSLEVGWGSYELLRGKVGYREKNVLGAGRTFRTEISGSFKHREFQAGITDPWFFRSGFTADLPFFYRYREEPSFTRRDFDLSPLLSRRLGPDTTTSVGYNYRITELSELDVDETIEDFDRHYNLGSLELQLTNDTRNDIFFPTAGHRFFISGEIADTVLGSDLDFFRLTTGIRRFFSLTSRLVLGLRYNTGILLPTRQQDTIPLGERYYNGGENSVRSFRQDQLGPKDSEGEAIGGLAFNIVSAELRYLITGPFIGTVFLDYGNISPNESHDDPENTLFGTDRSRLAEATFDDYFRNFRPAVGLGLQYMLPVGPARLDVGLNPEVRENEREYTIHFSVGQSF